MSLLRAPFLDDKQGRKDDKREIKELLLAEVAHLKDKEHTAYMQRIQIQQNNSNLYSSILLKAGRVLVAFVHLPNPSGDFNWQGWKKLATSMAVSARDEREKLQEHLEELSMRIEGLDLGRPLTDDSPDRTLAQLQVERTLLLQKHQVSRWRFYQQFKKNQNIAGAFREKVAQIFKLVLTLLSDFPAHVAKQLQQYINEIDAGLTLVIRADTDPEWYLGHDSNSIFNITGQMLRDNEAQDDAILREDPLRPLRPLRF